MPPSTKTWELCVRVTKGRLPAVLKELREAGWSTERISKELGRRYKIEVSGETVRRWLQQLDDESNAEQAAASA